VNLAPSTSTEILLADMSEVLIGDEMSLCISMSDVAAFRDSGGTLQSAFSRDSTVIRAIARHDLVLRREAACHVLYGSNTTC
jgi:HK97 family phage major capsid protein